MTTKVKTIAVLIATICLLGCSTKTYPADTGAIKYANRTSPGSKLVVKNVLVPDKMNIVYFFADW